MIQSKKVSSNVKWPVLLEAFQSQNATLKMSTAMQCQAQDIDFHVHSTGNESTLGKSASFNWQLNAHRMFYKKCCEHDMLDTCLLNAQPNGYSRLRKSEYKQNLEHKSRDKTRDKKSSRKTRGSNDSVSAEVSMNAFLSCITNDSIRVSLKVFQNLQILCNTSMPPTLPWHGYLNCFWSLIFSFLLKTRHPLTDFLTDQQEFMKSDSLVVKYSRRSNQRH